ncbi:MAG: hypothetical protein M3O70_20035 [Actinomycetota bacterium]|nr:hypothetical protein [Actinomycetota bacterium]
MRRITILVTALLFALTTVGGTAVARQPPGELAQDLFGSVGNNPVPGHPGAAGPSTPHRWSGQLTEDSKPTAWNAVEHADPIKSSCAS